MSSPVAPSFHAQGYPYHQQPPPPQSLVQDTIALQSIVPYETMADTSDWGYSMQTAPQSAYSPISSVHRAVASGMITGSSISTGTASNPWHTDVASSEEADNSPYRNWSTDPQYGTLDPLVSTPMSASSSSPTLDPSLRGSVSMTSATSQYSGVGNSASWTQTPAAIPSQLPLPQPEMHASAHARSSQEALSTNMVAGPHNPPYDQSMYASASYTQRPRHPHSQGAYGQSSTVSPSAIPPLPRHTYTRTLVGPLSANACRLQDEHRKLGVFFLFQDLSIRTEGKRI